jgi:membrane protein
MKLLPPVLRHALAVPLDLWRSAGRHDLFLNAAGSAFFLFLSIPPALLSLVSLLGLIPIEAWSQALREGSGGWLHQGIEQVVPPFAVGPVGLGLELLFAPVVSSLGALTPETVVRDVREFLRVALPPELAETVSGLVEAIVGRPHRSLLTVGFVTILWSASGVTRTGMRALSRIYEADQRAWWVRNLLSLVLTVGFLLTWVVAIALLPLSEALASLLAGLLDLDPGLRSLWSWVNGGVAAVVLLVAVVSFHRAGPDVSLRWRAVLPGSVFTVALWIGLSLALRAWIERSWADYSATYGTLAVVIVLLMWCYFLCIGLLLGGEVNTAILRLRRLGLGRAGVLEVREATRLALEGELEPLPVMGQLERTVGAVTGALEKPAAGPEVESGKD